MARAFLLALFVAIIPVAAHASDVCNSNYSDLKKDTTPSQWYNYLGAQAQPSYTFTIGGANNSGLFNPQSSGLQNNYALSINPPIARVSHCAAVLSSANYSRAYGNTVSSSVTKNLIGGFNVQNIDSITEQLSYVGIVKSLNTKLTLFTISAGTQYAHADCCNALAKTFNPEGVYHDAFFAVDGFIGRAIGQGFSPPQKQFDILVQLSSGPHAASDAYLESLATSGQADQGANTLVTVRPRFTFTLDSCGLGYTQGYVSYTHNGARYDDTPQPLYTNSYQVGADRQLAWWVTIDANVNTNTQSNYEQAFVLPKITSQTSITLDALITPLPWEPEAMQKETASCPVS